MVCKACARSEGVFTFWRRVTRFNVLMCHASCGAFRRPTRATCGHTPPAIEPTIEHPGQQFLCKGTVRRRLLQPGGMPTPPLHDATSKSSGHEKDGLALRGSCTCMTEGKTRDWRVPLGNLGASPSVICEHHRSQLWQWLPQHVPSHLQQRSQARHCVAPC